MTNKFFNFSKNPEFASYVKTLLTKQNLIDFFFGDGKVNFKSVFFIGSSLGSGILYAYSGSQTKMILIAEYPIIPPIKDLLTKEELTKDEGLGLQFVRKNRTLMDEMRKVKIELVHQQSVALLKRDQLLADMLIKDYEDLFAKEAASAAREKSLWVAVSIIDSHIRDYIYYCVDTIKTSGWLDRRSRVAEMGEHDLTLNLKSKKNVK